jgi:hypothetical protein
MPEPLADVLEREKAERAEMTKVLGRCVSGGTARDPHAVGGVDGMPALLLHGTAAESVEAILADGLIPADPNFWGPVRSRPVRYPTRCRQSSSHRPSSTPTPG